MPFASMILNATYEATLSVAAVLAMQRKSRVTVYLTAVGGGAFGNRTGWIVAAMENAMKTFKSAPLDVKLVHFATVPRSTYSDLEKGQKPKAGATMTAAAAPAAPAPAPAAPTPAAVAAPPAADATSTAPPLDGERVTALFAQLDANGDGVIQREELISVLGSLDPGLTAEALDKIFEAADANGDGEIHYAEFMAWVFAADADMTAKMLACCTATDQQQ
eukprot:TRINITY_DN20713_c0_g1_i1.p2 TRINITY_DN20713_c0_g1~~TRINITY_DN20713_c0_g1_i1.p2  ORF type:complete len:219 (-),score=53.34 TRINITY_DN20713_c0_g1_i1:326-982(-)